MGVAQLSSLGDVDSSTGLAVEVRAGHQDDERPSGAHPVAREHADLAEGPRATAALAMPGGARTAPLEAWERLGEQLRARLSGHAVVLLLGEPGVGKRYSVRTLHQSGLLPELGVVSEVSNGAALEIELAAWTSTTAAAPPRASHASTSGIWRTPSPATLVVHEVEYLPQQSQIRLHEAILRFRASERGQHPRIIATSSADLERAVSVGTFLPELLATLRTSQVWLSPLRARRHEIEPLARRFFDVAKGRSAKVLPMVLCPSAMARLCGYDWPGNVAQLEKVVEDAVRSCASPTLGVEALCAVLPELASTPSVPTILPPSGVDLREAVDALENSLILQALARTRWNKNQAAKLLGLNRTTLVEMLKRKGIREA